MAAPDDPTRRIPPDHEPPPGGVREREVLVDDPDAGFRQHVMDRLDTLKTWLAIATILALMGLGLAAYTLLTAEEEDDARQGATRGQVDQLEDRVDDVESQIGDAPSDDAVAKLRSGQQDLEERVKAVEDSAEEGDDEPAVDPDELQQSLDELSTAIEQLDQRVSDLEQAQQQEEEQQP